MSRSDLTCLSCRALLACVVVSILATGCGSASLPPLDAAWLEPPGLEVYQDAPAVVLYDHHELEFLEPSLSSLVVHVHHRVVQIVEPGSAHQWVLASPWDSMEVDARVVSPDGQVASYDNDALLALGGGEGGEVELPGVVAGSLVETRVWRRHERLHMRTDVIALERKIPTQHFEAVLIGPAGLHGELAAFNLQVESTRESLDDGRWRVSIRAADVASQPPDQQVLDSSSHKGVTGPWWGWRVESAAVADPAERWASALGERIEALYAPWGVTFPDLAMPCVTDDLVCRVRAVSDAVAARLELDDLGMGSPRDRDMSRALHRDRGDVLDKAAFVVHWLDTLGIEARFALTSRHDAHPFDASFPVPQWLDHVLVYVPKQPGLERALWFDPSCEHCVPNALPSWLSTTPAVVVWQEGGQPRAELRAIEGQRVARGNRRWTTHVRVHPDRRVSATALYETDAALAVSEMLASRDGSARREDRARWRRREVLERGDGIEVLDASSQPCDRRRGVCRTEVAFEQTDALVSEPDDAEVFGLALVGLMATPWDAVTFVDEGAVELVIQNDQMLSQEVDIDPAGWFTIDALPQPLVLESDGARLAFEVATLDDGRVRLTRRLELVAGRYPGASQRRAVLEVLRASSALMDQTVRLRAVQPLHDARDAQRLVESWFARDLGALYTAVAAAGRAPHGEVTTLVWQVGTDGFITDVELPAEPLDATTRRALLMAASSWRTHTLAAPIEAEVGFRVDNGTPRFVAEPCGGACRVLGNVAVGRGDLERAGVLYDRACGLDGDAQACRHSAWLATDDSDRRGRLEAACRAGDALACRLTAPVEAVTDDDVDALLLDYLAPRVSRCARDGAPLRRVEATWTVDAGRTRDLALPGDLDAEERACLEAALDGVSWPHSNLPLRVARTLRL